MFGLFKKNNDKTSASTTETTQYNTAPGTEIRYAPDLIDSLKGDHQSLLTLYGEIQEAFDHRDRPRVPDVVGPRLERKAHDRDPLASDVDVVVE